MDAEKVFDKIQHCFMLKNFQHIMYRRNLPQYSEGHIWPGDLEQDKYTHSPYLYSSQYC
jgi:hypothetical protein